MTTPNSPTPERPALIGLVSISDRASSGVYQDLGLPGLKDWLGQAIASPWQTIERLIPDDRQTISSTLIALSDQDGCDLIFTTGGTGPAPRDVTPEATLDIADKELPGFGEQMRQISLHYVPTAILSRQLGVIRGKTMIVNLPGQPKSIAETLGGVRSPDGQILVHGIFSAIPYGLELIGGPSILTHDAFCKAFRPKKK
jgi:molybdopterin adenylyltransferase